MFTSNIAGYGMEEQQQGRFAFREFKGLPGKLLVAFIAAFFLYHVAYAFGIFTTRLIYVGSNVYVLASITLTLPLVFLFVPATKSAPIDKVPWYDVILILASLAACSYMLLNVDTIMAAFKPITTTGLILGTAAIIAVLEALRRTLGAAITVLVVLVFLYAMYSNLFPGILWSRGFSYDWMVSYCYLYDTGMFGHIAHLWAKIVVLYLLFAGIIQVSGASKLLMDFTLGIVGHLKGGPAKVAVIASALFGSMSPAGAANIATTGSITIPMMKNTGMPPERAAAVETVASIGGQITPPMMSSLTFVIAEFLEMPYYSVVISTLLPAVLYYFYLFLTVHFDAQRLALPVIPRGQMPSAKMALKQGWHYTLPVIVLIVFLLIMHYSPQASVLYALATLLVVGQFKKDSRLNLQRLWAGTKAALRLTVLLAPIFIAVGIISASLGLTALPIRLGFLLPQLCHGNLLLLLLLAAFACFIMGTGLPLYASYLVLAILIVPALVEAGVVPIAAHLFILYAALTHFVTPPVMTGVYVAAGIAKSDIWRTSAQAIRLGLVMFIIPFILVYNPALLLQGISLQLTVITVAVSLAGVLGLSAGIVGWLNKRANWFQRILLIASGIMMLSSVNMIITASGFCILALIFLWQGITPMGLIRKVRSALGKGA